MTLLDCQKNQSYTILKIEGCDDALKNRFLSFGIVAGAQFVLLHHSLQKATLSIALGRAQIALRAHEAKCILVKPLWKPRSLKNSC